MKRNPIARIIIFSLLLLILVPTLIFGIAAGQYAVRVDYDSYAMGSGELPASQMREIEIEWASGSITVETADTDTITFHEVGDSNSEPMVYRVEGSKLTISHAEPKVYFGFNFSSDKDLYITLPRDWNCEELSINAASTELTVNDLTAGEIDFDSASGNGEFNRCNVSELNVDCASGTLFFTGSLSTLDCDTASGDVTAILQNVPRSISFDGASADLDLTLPENAGFSLLLDSISGKFTSEFPTIHENGRYICGDGECKIEVDGASGNVTIRKG